MSFPDVPIDETLFEGNALMRDYWERSTENRSMHFVPDVRHEELALPDDVAELRAMSEEALRMDTRFKTVAAPALGKTVEVEPTLDESEDPVDAPVAPKSAAGAWGIGIAIGVGFILILLYVGYVGRSRRE